MSLFLRKACQEHLDGVGLQNYHIQVDDASKCLLIVGECGDTLVSIAGIRLSRMAPGDKEIELAIDLFDDFLAKHTGTFKEFIAAKIRADRAQIPLTPPNLMDAKVVDTSYQNYWQLTFDLKSLPSTRVTVRSNGYVHVPGMTFDLVLDPSDSIQHCISTAERRSIESWMKACTEYHEATTQKERLLEALSSCEI